MLHKRLWPFYDMRRMINWSNHSSITSRAKPKKEPKMWCCPCKFAAALDALPTK
jgi:hypothetical protein